MFKEQIRNEKQEREKQNAAAIRVYEQEQIARRERAKAVKRLGRDQQILDSMVKLINNTLHQFYDL